MTLRPGGHWMATLLLAAVPCWSVGAQEPAPTPPATATPPAGATGGAVGEVVSAPFKDLNLVKTQVPPVLAALNGYPYGPPTEAGCEALAKEIAALDEVLGSDLDAAAVAGKRGRSLAAKTLTQAAHSLVPYRSWVRKLSGAEKRDAQFAAALITGTTRRAYLKGLGSAQGCAPPAAPLPEPPPAEPQRPPNR